MSSDNTHPITIEQLVTPWDVRGEVVDGVSTGINYAKLMDQFGCQPLTPELISRFERLVGERAHPLLKRGAFYCHRDFDKMLDLFENGKQFYLYTGRGPSSESMHLGHMIPFVFCQYLQRVFKCHLVIQLTDDEKFLFKPNLTVEKCREFARQNAKDIIACGFNPEKTQPLQFVIFCSGAYDRCIVLTLRTSPKFTSGFISHNSPHKGIYGIPDELPTLHSTFPLPPLF